MKKIMLSLLATSLLFVSCQLQGNNTKDSNSSISDSISANTGEIGKMEFEETEFNFGKIKEGEVVKHKFVFTNTGKSPVILAQVSASCGCTTPTFTSEPVLPGKEGEINVEFNSAGQAGQQQKIITIASNAESNIMTVQLRGEVESK